MTNDHLSLWEKWITIPHIKETWFIDGYETSSYIHEKIKGNGHTVPFIIYLDHAAIGYIQYCDLYAFVC